MISDYVKGKKKFDYPYGIQQGIMLHRAIDNFTDNHEATKNAKEVFRPVYRLYSGAVMDVLYDHFLATDAAEFTEASLYSFSQEVYDTLDKYSNQLPEYFAGIFPSMKQHNWLLNYRNRLGTQRSLGGLVKRAAYLTESGTAFNLFEKHYDFLKECYHNLWVDIKPFTLRQLKILQNEADT